MAAVSFLLLACVSIWRVGQGAFDCHRPGSECQNGGRCEADGSCTCWNSWGLNCMYSAAEYSEGDVNCRVDLGCMSQKCLTAQGGQPAVCVCGDGRTGPRCEQDRFQFRCFGDRIAYNIVPYGNFTGYIYRLSLGQYNNPKCRVCDLKEAATSDTDPAWEGYGGVQLFEHNTESCPGQDVTLIESLTNTLVKYMYFLIQYSPEGLRDNDEIIQFKCSFPRSQAREYRANLETQRLSPSLLHHETVKGTSENFAYSLLNEMKTHEIPANSTVYIGDKLFLQVNLSQSADLSDVAIRRCTLMDAATRQEARFAMDILDYAGCPLPTGDVSYEKEDRSAIVGFRVIRFTFSPLIYVYCEVEGCAYGDASRCRQSSSCESKKKRREATAKTGGHLTQPPSQPYHIIAPIRVLDHHDKKPAKKVNEDFLTWNADFDLCMKTGELRAILVFLVVALTALTTTLCGCAAKHFCFFKTSFLCENSG